MIKRNFFIFMMICIMAACLAACAKETTGAKNEIAPKELNREQQDIVDLLATDTQEILLFEYKTEQPYKKINFWVEVYENGVLADKPSGVGILSGTAKPLDGQAAILLNQNEDFQCTLTLLEGDTRTSHTGTYAYKKDSGLARGYGPINGPVAIESGKEIILYTSIFTYDSMVSYSDQQIYIEQPELISQYPYVYIVKCKFE